uniref:RNA polymerase II subunit B1 CTD phosphatase RPAP2 homolog n=1 Tax=Sphenodon punctatus TaxID=8508 RepID=A0A8D0GDU2_SPHPU
MAEGKARVGVEGRANRRRSGNEQSSALKNVSVAQRRATFEAAIRKKVEFEKKALHIVEQLLEDDITGEFLVDCGKHVSPSHYKDVVDERSILRLCGYPLCQNRLENVPKQKYRISTKTNKVYDITERKCFCSNFCYQASKYFEAQIPHSPVWMREEERPPNIELLKEGQSGQSGEEVKLRDETIIASDVEYSRVSTGQCESGSPGTDSDSSNDAEQEFVSSILPGNQPKANNLAQPLPRKSIFKNKDRQKANSKHVVSHSVVMDATEKLSMCGLDSKEGKYDSSANFQSKQTDPSPNNPIPENVQTPETCENNSQVVFLGVSKKGAQQLKRMFAKSKQPIKPSSSTPADSRAAKDNLLEALRQTFMEWRTEETLKFLYGSNYTASCLSEHTSPASCVREELDEDDLETVDDLNDTAAKMESNSMNHSFKSSGTKVKALPSYEKLKEETELLELRVREFYKGKCILAEEKATALTEGEEHLSSYKGDQQVDPTFPLIESSAQKQIQKRIFLEKLKKVSLA